MTSSTVSRSLCHERHRGRAAQQELVQLLTLDPPIIRQAWRGAFCPPPSCFRHRFRASPKNAASLEPEGEHCFQTIQSPRNHGRHTVLRLTTVFTAQSSTERSSPSAANLAGGMDGTTLTVRRAYRGSIRHERGAAGALQPRRRWSGRPESNRRRPAWEAGCAALCRHTL